MASKNLQSAFSSPIAQSQAVKPAQSLENAWTEEPSVVYALDAEGNRLFPYILVVDEKNIDGKVRLMNCMNRACLSETGRETLQQSAETGLSFLLHPEMSDDRGGFYNHDHRVICINAHMNDDFMCNALVHEARHSIQFDQVPKMNETFKDFDLDFKSFMILNRAMEADAVAVQAKCAAELAALGDTGVAEGAPNYRHVVNVYEQAAKEGKLDAPDTMKKAADAWYKNYATVDWYDNYYSEFEPKRVSGRKEIKTLSDEQPDFFVGSLFKFKDCQYAGNSAEYLKTPEKLSCSDKAYKRVAKANKMYGQTDTSIDRMYSVDPVSLRPTDCTHGQKKLAAKEKQKNNLKQKRDAFYNNKQPSSKQLLALKTKAKGRSF